MWKKIDKNNCDYYVEKFLNGDAHIEEFACVDFENFEVELLSINDIYHLNEIIDNKNYMVFVGDETVNE